MALLTIQQQQAIKTISQNWANFVKLTGGLSNYQQLEIEVENKEFRQLLGVPFLQDIQANPLTALNVLILDGGSFINCNGETIYFKGLRFVLSFMVFSAYVIESSISDTFTGMVKKNRDESESLSLGEKKIMQQNSREIALQEWELIKEYLVLNESSYPLWHYGKTKKVYTPKIFGIKRTIL